MWSTSSIIDLWFSVAINALITITMSFFFFWLVVSHVLYFLVNSPLLVSSSYWVYHVGRDLVMVSKMSQKFSIQSEPTTHVMWFGSVSNSFFKWSPIASDCWFQVVPQKVQNLSLVGPPPKISHVCRIIIWQSILATSRLFLHNHYLGIY